MNRVAPRQAIALLAIATILLLMPHSALAQLGAASAPTNTNFTDISSPDPSNQYLAMIWGTALFPSSGGPGATVLGQLSGMLNTIVLTVGAAFFTWQLITGTVQSAHHGEVLGKEWSSLWVPIRFVAAGAMMIPAGTGGTILMQQMVAYIVQIGMKAGMLCALYVMSQISAGVPLSALPTPSYDDVAENVWHMSLCISEHNYSGVTPGGATNGFSMSQGSVSDGSTVFTVNGGGFNGVSPCGTITVTPNSSPMYSAYAKAQVAAVQSLFSAFQPMTNQIAQAIHPDAGDYPPLPTPGQIAAAIAAVQPILTAASVNSANNAALGPNASPVNGQAQSGSVAAAMASNMFQNFTSCGWVCIGAYYNTLAEMNSAVSHAVNSKPTYSPFDSAELPQEEAEAADFRGADALANQFWSRRSNPSEANWPPGANPYAQYVASQNESFSSKIGSAFGKFTAGKLSDIIVPVIVSGLSGLSYVLSGGWVANLASAGDGIINPLSSLSFLGETIVTAATTVTVNLSTAMATAGGIPILGQAVIAFENGPFGSLLNFALEALIGAGGFLAYVMPMMPYIIWMMAVLGYFTLVTEALIAAPLWAFAHLKSGGNGIHGEAGAGYMIVFNMLMRPSLMTAGLVAGMALFSVGVDVLTNTFATAAQDTLSGMGLTVATAGGGAAGGMAIAGQAASAGFAIAKGIGISGVIILMLSFLIKFIIFVVLVVIIGERSFSLIHKLPDTVVRWFGGHAENLGESEASHGARGMIISGAGKAHSIDDSYKEGSGKRLAKALEDKKEKDRIDLMKGQGGSVSSAIPSGEAGTRSPGRAEE